MNSERRITSAISYTQYPVRYGPSGEANQHDKNGQRRRTTPHLQAFRYRIVQSAVHAMKTPFAQARVPWRGFHVARKHAGTKLLRRTGDLATVAAFLSYSSMDTTRNSYTAVVSDAASDEMHDW